MSVHPCRADSLGFTLIELLMSVSIGAIVISMVVGGMVALNRQMTVHTNRSLAQQEARLLADHLIDQIRMAGGGNAYPYASVWVENNVNNLGSDAIIMASLSDHSLQAFATYPAAGTMVILSSTGSACILSGSWRHKHVMVVDRSEQFWSLWHVTAVNQTQCLLSVEPSYETGLNNVPSGSTTSGAMVRVAAVDVSRLRLDESNQQLMKDSDSDGDNVAESLLLADRVVDLQAALGYDIAPWDWRVSDTSDTTDEWLYNAFGEALGGSSGQRLDQAKRTDLRMLRIAVIVSAPVPGVILTSSLRVLDGPVRSRPNQVLSSGIVSVGLRNYNILR